MTSLCITLTGNTWFICKIVCSVLKGAYMEIVKKITTAIVEDITTKYDGKKAKVEKSLDVMRVVGVCNGYDIKTTQYGDSFCFKGDFLAIRLDNKTEYKSAQLYLPAIAATILATAIDVNPEVKIQFAYDIFLNPPKGKNDKGYEWGVRPLIESADNDPVRSLLASLPNPKMISNK